MRNMRLGGIGLAVFFLTTGTLYAQHPGKGEKEYDGPKDRLIRELNLTTEQQSRLEENRKVQREEMKKLHEAVREKYAKLQEALKNPAVTREGVQPIANEMKSLQAQLIDSRINGIFAVKQILTPEQFARFQQMAQKRQENRKGRFLKWCEEKLGRGKSDRNFD